MSDYTYMEMDYDFKPGGGANVVLVIILVIGIVSPILFYHFHSKNETSTQYEETTEYQDNVNMGE